MGATCRGSGQGVAASLPGVPKTPPRAILLSPPRGSNQLDSGTPEGWSEDRPGWSAAQPVERTPWAPLTAVLLAVLVGLFVFVHGCGEHDHDDELRLTPDGAPAAHR